jgi:hypothetical protein
MKLNNKKTTFIILTTIIVLTSIILTGCGGQSLEGQSNLQSSLVANEENPDQRVALLGGHVDPDTLADEYRVAKKERNALEAQIVNMGNITNTIDNNSTDNVVENKFQNNAIN